MGLLLLLSIHLAGCTTHSSEPDAGDVGTPRIGDRALYAIGDTGRTIELHVAGERTILDASGAPVSAMEIRLTRVYEWGRSIPIQFIDSVGNLVLAGGKCGAFAQGFLDTETGCETDKRFSATYMEHGLPGALGASKFWGGTFKEGTFGLNLSFLGNPLPLIYQVSFPKADCVEFQSTGQDPPLLADQRFSAQAGAPTSIIFCQEDPFPVRVTLPDYPESMTRIASERGTRETDLEESMAKDPWHLPAASEARSFREAPPYSHGYDHTAFPVQEALDYLREDHPDGRAFLKAHPDAFVRFTFGIRDIYGKLHVVDRETFSKSTRNIILEGRDGATFSIRLTKQCDALTCNITGSNEATGRATPSLPDPDNVRSLSYQHLEGIANRTLTHPVGAFSTMGSVLLDVQGPEYRHGKGWLFTFYASDPEGGTLPLQVTLEAWSGKVISFDLPRKAGLRLVGLPPDY